jgi:hypothetical protein
MKNVFIFNLAKSETRTTDMMWLLTTLSLPSWQHVNRHTSKGTHHGHDDGCTFHHEKGVGGLRHDCDPVVSLPPPAMGTALLIPLLLGNSSPMLAPSSLHECVGDDGCIDPEWLLSYQRGQLVNHPELYQKSRLTTFLKIQIIVRLDFWCSSGWFTNCSWLVD